MNETKQKRGMGKCGSVSLKNAETKDVKVYRGGDCNNEAPCFKSKLRLRLNTWPVPDFGYMLILETANS